MAADADDVTDAWAAAVACAAVDADVREPGVTVAVRQLGQDVVTVAEPIVVVGADCCNVAAVAAADC